MLTILVVDDEPMIDLSVGDALRSAGHRVTVTADGAEALAALGAQAFDLVISDVHMPKVSGMDVLHHVCVCAPDTDVILITAYGVIEGAVNALKQGAKDYLTKPFSVDELLLRVRRIAEQRELTHNLLTTRLELAERTNDEQLIGCTPAMAQLRERIATLSLSNAAVLITGESGTGKELVARSLHERSARRDRPFIAVNCSAFPETLIEGELFGYERGAFTGAVKGREGRFKAAHGGTLFLDEVAEMPLSVQVKLLRVLQEREIEPLGTNTPIRIDVRVISATHRNLKRFIEAERFREDLYYRLNVLDISIPPLRERAGDIPVLIRHFLESLLPRGQKLPGITPCAFAALTAYPFPGNVRELKHAVEHAVVLSRGQEIDLMHLPADVRGTSACVNAAPQAQTLVPLAVAVRDFERSYLLRALDATRGKKVTAAERLGISRKTLWEKLRAHQILIEDTSKGGQ